MDTVTMDEFKGRIEAADNNVRTLTEYEPSMPKVILYLAMSAALDCADAEDPDEAIATDLDIIGRIVELTGMIKGERDIVTHKFDNEPALDDDEWLEMFLDAQGFLEDVIKAHVDEYGDSTEEERIMAFTETSNSIVYMCASACSSCDDIPRALRYCRSSIERTYKYITEECTLVPKDEIES